MNTTTHRPVLLGTDGCEHSTAALEWAVAEAVRRDRDLRVLHAVPVTLGGIHALPAMEHQEAHAEQVVSETTERAHRLAPDLTVTTVRPVGDAAASLVHESRTADLVVVGARGRGAVAGAFLGSTSLHVAGHAHCPVAVVRHRADADTPRTAVVVGVDGSGNADAALGEAFRLADERGMPLVVVHGSTAATVGTHLAVVDSPELRERIAEYERSSTEHAVAGWRQKYPGVDVDVRVVDEHPVLALTDAAADAAILVVGSRGLGGFGGLVLGSVGQGVLHRAQCPVLVVRPESG
ncbi:universal stress protein [Phycicoccus sp. BSK3Z-2]|uniref:Universal stress protein n=1 Tax=Phycicoccus avicenniae TaxID=2828860 RepID=A0A941D5E3_9MICO|nr:universal stress protein [Phycicoccus avicenniae]MBR7742434.1 universal stress protein [Phycicoccus avicenniae]